LKIHLSEIGLSWLGNLWWYEIILSNIQRKYIKFYYLVFAHFLHILGIVKLLRRL